MSTRLGGAAAPGRQPGRSPTVGERFLTLPSVDGTTEPVLNSTGVHQPRTSKLNPKAASTKTRSVYLYKLKKKNNNFLVLNIKKSEQILYNASLLLFLPKLAIFGIENKEKYVYNFESVSEIL